MGTTLPAELVAFLAKLKPQLDEARKIADIAIAGLEAADTSIIGEIVLKGAPFVSPAISCVTVLDGLLDKLDDFVDSSTTAPPAAVVTAK